MSPLTHLTRRVVIPKFLRSEAACGQAGQGRREVGKGSALPGVTRRRATEDAEMRSATCVQCSSHTSSLDSRS